MVLRGDLQYGVTETVSGIAAECWAWLCRESWNPFLGAIFAGIFGGVFALYGARIGGCYVLRSLEEQRRRDRIAAGRALSSELENNITSAAALAAAGIDAPRAYLTFRPSFSRLVLDDRLTLLSELLTTSEFFTLTSTYATAQASFELLEMQARRDKDFTMGAMQKFAEHALDFATAAEIVAGYV
jgi:hypothetical protein